MSIIAIIPARCGSKEIPYKNIYPINNKPLISYCINALSKSNIDNFFVSTDCEKIANIAYQYGASIIDRPSSISNDISPTIDCILHGIKQLHLNDNDIVLTIQPTSPLIQPQYINDAIEKLKIKSGVISTTLSHYITWNIDSDNIVPLNHDPLKRLRRQEKQNIVHENGMIYGAKSINIQQFNSVYGSIDNIGYILIPKIHSIEIDCYDDLFIAEQILKKYE